MEIGEKLRNLRIQKNLTQEELGERTDLSKGYISQLERDLSSPSMETFFSILEVLGVTPEEFFIKKQRICKWFIQKKIIRFISMKKTGMNWNGSWLIRMKKKWSLSC